MISICMHTLRNGKLRAWGGLHLDSTKFSALFSALFLLPGGLQSSLLAEGLVSKLSLLVLALLRFLFLLEGSPSSSELSEVELPSELVLLL